jgi:hypothetical protein
LFVADDQTMKAADAVWLATALIQRERGREAEISVAEIVDRAAAFNGVSRSTLRTMASQHLVATAPPNPDRYRMLTATGRGKRRLFRAGDPVDSRRLGSPTHPDPESLPAEFHALVEWYLRSYCRENPAGDDPVRDLHEWSKSTGIWRGIDPDRYVQELRAGWE